MHEQVVADCVGFLHVRRARRHGAAHVAFRARGRYPSGGTGGRRGAAAGHASRFQGYRLLQEYFAFPERFLFFELRQSARGVAGCDGDEIEIFLAMGRAQPALENALDASHFRLGCTPVVNLFPRQTDRIHVTSTTDGAAPGRRPQSARGFRGLFARAMQAIGVGGESISEVAPFYSADHRTDASRPMAYYTLQRRPRLLPMRQQQSGARAGYMGSECFLSLVDTGTAAAHR